MNRKADTMTDGQLLIDGEWVPSTGGRVEEIRSPYDGRVVGQAAIADLSDADKALAAAEHGAAVWRETPAHARFDILMRAATLVAEGAETIAALLSAENGKTITEARGEVGRAADMIRLAGFEGTQLYGDSLPLDRTGAPALTRWGSRSASLAAWSSRSPRSTIRRCWCCTRSRRRWRPATPSS